MGRAFWPFVVMPKKDAPEYHVRANTRYVVIGTEAHYRARYYRIVDDKEQVVSLLSTMFRRLHPETER